MIPPWEIRSIRPAMLAHEGANLEMLCERLSELCVRLSAAEKTGNTGLIEGLTLEMDRLTRMRDRLVRYILTRLGSDAADPIRAGSGRERAAPPH